MTSGEGVGLGILVCMAALGAFALGTKAEQSNLCDKIIRELTLTNQTQTVAQIRQELCKAEK